MATELTSFKSLSHYMGIENSKTVFLYKIEFFEAKSIILTIKNQLGTDYIKIKRVVFFIMYESILIVCQ